MVCSVVVDSIEANVETASVSVEEGMQQLRQARHSQVRWLLLLVCKVSGTKNASHCIKSMHVNFNNECLETKKL